MLATTHGVAFDPDKSWDEKREFWRISNKIVTITSITQTAVGDKKGLRATVVTGAIFIPEPLFHTQSARLTARWGSPLTVRPARSGAESGCPS